jgi:hypothetical protein
VRAGADEDHRVSVSPLQIRVVLPAAQVITDLVMGGESDPGRPGDGFRRIGQEDGDLFPVGLMVVDTTEGRPPVVHRVQEPVLQRDEPPVPGDVTVVGIAIVVGSSAVILLGRSRRAAGHPPPYQQRKPEARVNQPAQQADDGEPAAAWRQPRSPRLAPPRAVFTARERALDETQ